MLQQTASSHPGYGLVKESMLYNPCSNQGESPTQSWKVPNTIWMHNYQRLIQPTLTSQVCYDIWHTTIIHSKFVFLQFGSTGSPHTSGYRFHPTTIHAKRKPLPPPLQLYHHYYYPFLGWKTNLETGSGQHHPTSHCWPVARSLSSCPGLPASRMSLPGCCQLQRDKWICFWCSARVTGDFQSCRQSFRKTLKTHTLTKCTHSPLFFNDVYIQCRQHMLQFSSTALSFSSIVVLNSSFIYCAWSFIYSIRFYVQHHKRCWTFSMASFHTKYLY